MVDQLTARKKAIDLHEEQANLFSAWYGQFEKDPYFNAFTYGRKQFLEFLEPVMKSRVLPRAQVLDIGCGSGHMLGVLKEWGYEVSGIEPAKNMREIAQKENPGVAILQGRADSLPFPSARFDAVLAIEVFRYLEEQDCVQGYKEAMRVLKPGGFFFFTLANTYSLNGFALYYVLKRLWNFLFKREMHYDHFTTPGSITAQLKKEFAGDVGSVTTRGVAFAPLHIAYKVFRPFGAQLARILEPLDKRLSRTQYYAPLAANLVVIVEKNR